MPEEASTSRCKKHLYQTSTSNHTVAEKSSHLHHWGRETEIKQLEKRLRILEEEAEMLKGAVLESAEESRKIITDIHMHFNTIQDCILQRELGRAESYVHGIHKLSHRKDQRADLLQILCQESSPYIVNKGSRTNHY